MKKKNKKVEEEIRTDDKQEKEEVEVEEETGEEKPEEKEECESLEARVKRLKKEKQEYVSHMQRLQAEFDNFRKRVNKEKTTWGNLSLANFFKKMLPILSDMHRAVDHNPDPQTETEKGFHLIFNKFKDLMKKEGLEELDALGEEFDPDFHDALQIIEVAEGEDNVVLQEFEKGYKFKDVIIQHSKVIVSKLKQEPEEKPEVEEEIKPEPEGKGSRVDEKA